jgi:hypothetical protein
MDPSLPDWFTKGIQSKTQTAPMSMKPTRWPPEKQLKFSGLQTRTGFGGLARHVIRPERRRGRDGGGMTPTAA